MLRIAATQAWLSRRKRIEPGEDGTKPDAGAGRPRRSGAINRITFGWKAQPVVSMTMANEIKLTFDNEIAPTSEDFGELFSALARDYRDMTKGRVLVISKIESGSIITVLTDYAQTALPYVKDGIETLKAVKAISDFGKLLKEWTGKVKSGGAKKKLYKGGRKPPGQRSMEAILKIAADSKSAVHIKQTNAKGEIVEVHMTPAEAIQIRTEALAEQSEVTHIVKVQAQPAYFDTLPSIQGAISGLTDHRLARLSLQDLESLARSLASVIKGAGLSYIAPQIASDLELRGHRNFAEAFRAEFPAETQKNQEPPLLT